MVVRQIGTYFKNHQLEKMFFAGYSANCQLPVYKPLQHVGEHFTLLSWLVSFLPVCCISGPPFLLRPVTRKYRSRRDWMILLASLCLHYGEITLFTNTLASVCMTGYSLLFKEPFHSFLISRARFRTFSPLLCVVFIKKGPIIPPFFKISHETGAPCGCKCRLWVCMDHVL